MVAAAVIGGAAIGAVGSAVAGGEAAGATKDATNASINQQNKALGQQAKLSEPYRELGSSAIPTYQALLSGPNVQQTLESMPGYKATLKTGVESAQRAAAASGLNLSGNQVAGVEEFGSQLADQTYQTQLNNLLNPIQLGQAAAAGQAANVGNAAATNSASLINQGSTLAGIDANTVAGVTKAAGTATNQAITLDTLNKLNSPGASSGQTYNV